MVVTVSMDEFNYSKDFRKAIIRLLRGKEHLPNYCNYLKDHLGGPSSRVVRFTKYLCPEIEYHCGNLKDKRTLDFGCGTGATTVALAQISREVCAFDTDQESIEVCKRRMKEHHLESKVQFYCADDLEQVKDSLGTFDLILVCGVIEHIPLTKHALRERILNSLFEMLKKRGYLYITDTPNRLYPFDFHTTQLWWIPWTKPGSMWAYRRAIKKGKHSESPTLSNGPLGLEERGVWGATYWEIKKYLQHKPFKCINLLRGHNRHLHYFKAYYKSMATWKRIIYGLFDYATYPLVVKLLHLPITTFFPGIRNLVLKKE